MSFAHPRARPRRLTHGSKKTPLLLNAYAGGLSMPHIMPAECVPVYFHVDNIPKQPHHQPPFQPSYHNRQESCHRSASFHSRQTTAHQFSSPPRFYPQSQVSPSRHYQIPPITDPYTLTRAVQRDPEAVFRQLQKVFQERDELKIQINSVMKDSENVKRDYVALLNGHERMEQIWLEKQLLMWKFVERVKANKKGSMKMTEREIAGRVWKYADGEEFEEKSVTKEDVENMWTQHFRARPQDDRGKEGLLNDENRGRSRVSKAVQQMSSDVTSTFDIESSIGASIAKSVKKEVTETVDARLDPNAKSFEPSPTRKSEQEASTQPNTIDDISTRLSAPPSFRDVLTGSSIVSLSRPFDQPDTQPSNRSRRSPEMPRTEVRHRKASSQENVETMIGNGRRSRSVGTSRTATVVSQDSSTTRGSKKSKSKRGGNSKIGTATQYSGKKQEFRKGNPMSTNENIKIQSKGHKSARNKEAFSGHGHPQSLRKLSSPWRRLHMEVVDRKALDTSGSKELPDEQPSKQSLPEARTTASSPPQLLPHRGPFPTPILQNLASPHNSPTSKVMQSHDGEMSPHFRKRSEILIAPGQAFDKLLEINANAFMSRARLQATLQSLAAPYDKVCPNSLLSSRQCRIEGCELLHLCPRFINALSPEVLSDEHHEEDFPALGCKNLQDSLKTTSNTCKNENGTIFQEGELCSTGYIHLKPSCMAEVEGVPCHFWNSPPRKPSSSNIFPHTSSLPITTSNKKFTVMNLDYNYTAPLTDLQRPSLSSSTMRSQNSFMDLHDRTQQVSSNDYAHNNTRERTLSELREAHFKTCVHERDGIGRDRWYARCLNAELRRAHESGLWGVKEKVSFEEVIDWAEDMHDQEERQSAEIADATQYEGRKTRNFGTR